MNNRENSIFKRITISPLGIILLLILIIIIESFTLANHMKPQPNYVKVESNSFKKEIRPVIWDSLEKHVYEIEGRFADKEYTENGIKYLCYYYAKVDNFTGTLVYGFIDNKLETVKFIFYTKSDYDNYLKQFKSRNSNGYLEYKDVWLWFGTSDRYSDTSFTADDSYYVITKSKYEL